MTETIFYVFAATTIGTIAVELRHRLNSTSETLKNRLRVRSWWVMILICLITFYSGPFAVQFFTTSLITWGTYEILSAESISKKLPWLIPTSLVAFYLQDLIVLKVLSLPIVAGLSLLFFFLSRITYMNKTARIPLLVLYLVSSLSTLSGFNLITLLGPIGFTDLLILFFLIVGLNDVFQYVSGKTFGKKKLAPIISPAKTIEGALGGMLLTSISVFSFALIHQFENLFSFALLGAFISLAGIAGDLHFSFFKRLWGLKNSGSGIPGHGGILDRIDSLALASPVFVILVTLHGEYNELANWIF